MQEERFNEGDAVVVQAISLDKHPGTCWSSQKFFAVLHPESLKKE